jgi:hypothetical protein
MAKVAAKTTGSSAMVRELAVRRYVSPNVRKRAHQFSIPVRSLMLELRESGFPAENTPQICTAIRSKKFLNENNLEIERIDGPPSGQSTTVVVYYRFRELKNSGKPDETAAERAKRIIHESAGLLQPVISEFGSADALLRWIRSEEQV